MAPAFRRLARDMGFSPRGGPNVDTMCIRDTRPGGSVQEPEPKQHNEPKQAVALIWLVQRRLIDPIIAFSLALLTLLVAFVWTL